MIHRRTTAASLLAAALLALSGCGGEPERVVMPPLADPDAADPFADVEPAELPALALATAHAPAEATVVAVTDWDEVRDRVGLPELTGRSPAADKDRFWREARTSAAVLTPSRLHDADARLLADFGFTADDVDWEATYAGPDGDGWALGLRPGAPLDGVRRAVRAGVAGLGGGRVLADEAVVVGGTALDDPDAAPSWRTDEELLPVVADAARERRPEAVHLQQGCVPPAEALGGRSGALDLGGLDPVDAFSVTFGPLVATARLGADRADLLERATLLGPGAAGGAGFDPDPAVDPSTGRLGLLLTDPPAAATAARRGALPFAVCPEA